MTAKYVDWVQTYVQYETVMDNIDTKYYASTGIILTEPNDTIYGRLNQDKELHIFILEGLLIRYNYSHPDPYNLFFTLYRVENCYQSISKWVTFGNSENNN